MRLTGVWCLSCELTWDHYCSGYTLAETLLRGTSRWLLAFLKLFKWMNQGPNQWLSTTDYRLASRNYLLLIIIIIKKVSFSTFIFKLCQNTCSYYSFWCSDVLRCKCKKIISMHSLIQWICHICKRHDWWQTHCLHKNQWLTIVTQDVKDSTKKARYIAHFPLIHESTLVRE